MNKPDRDSMIHRLGHELAKHCKKFYGSVQFNIQNGNYVNANIQESVKPEKQENKE